MIGEMVTPIGVTGRPTYIELVLFNPVLDPVELHVHDFGAFLVDCVIDDSVCSGVVSCDVRGILCMSHFRECCVRDSALFSIDKNCTEFSIINSRYHMFEHCSMAKD
jgi:hypothetical protein